VEFEWDEDKRRATIRKHRIDFIDAMTIFTEPFLRRPARSDVEPREIAIGSLGGTVIAVVYTMRGDRIRFVTARRARQDEQENFRTFHDRRNPPDERRN